jgi:hypothetical protein
MGSYKYSSKIYTRCRNDIKISKVVITCSNCLLHLLVSTYMVGYVKNKWFQPLPKTWNKKRRAIKGFIFILERIKILL